MISTNTTMVKVPSPWVGKSYFEFFDYLLYQENLMAIGIFRNVTRRVRPPRRKPSVEGTFDRENDLEQDVTWLNSKNADRLTSYVYTAPPGQETTMLASD